MKAKLSILLCLVCAVAVVFASSFAWALEGETISRTYRLQGPDVPAETQLDFVTTTEAGYEIEAGAAVFKTFISRHKVKFAYAGEWHSFEPLDHNLVTAVADGRRVTLRDYWPNTDVVYEAHAYGLKTSIVLKTANAPKSFEFAVDHSEGWNPLWIGQPLLVSDGHCIGLADESEDEGVLTYTIPSFITSGHYPLVLDPTYVIAASVDDTTGNTVNNDGNLYTLGRVQFGRFATPNIDKQAYLRFVSDIPKDSTITSAKLRFYAYASDAGEITNVSIHWLAQSGSPAWKGADGFHTDNYADGSALDAISVGAGSVGWSSVEAWTADNWYESPSLTSIVQSQVNDGDYDPNDAEDKYLGFKITHGDGGYASNKIREFDSYDQTGGSVAELVVEYDPPAAGAAQVIINIF